MKLNPDVRLVKQIMKGIVAKNGYCPCKIQETEDNLCPCKECIEENICTCGLYVKEE